MKRHHVVLITTRGYHRLASYETQAEALRHVANASNRTGSHVYRNGLTGKRYSTNESRAMRRQPDTERISHDPTHPSPL